MIHQQVSERSGNFCHHPAPIPGKWDYLQLLKSRGSEKDKSLLNEKH